MQTLSIYYSLLFYLFLSVAFPPTLFAYSPLNDAEMEAKAHALIAQTEYEGKSKRVRKKGAESLHCTYHGRLEWGIEIFTYRVEKQIYLSILKFEGLEHYEFFKMIPCETEEELQFEICYEMLHQKSNISTVSSLQKWHQAAYHEPLTIHHFKPSIFYNTSPFGITCGYGNTPPVQAQKMFLLAKNQDIRTLSTWLSSVDPLNKIYGYIGLHLIQRTGTPLSPSIQKAMSHVKKSPWQVHFCSGCTEHGVLLISQALKQYLTAFETKFDNMQ